MYGTGGWVWVQVWCSAFDPSPGCAWESRSAWALPPTWEARMESLAAAFSGPRLAFPAIWRVNQWIDEYKFFFFSFLCPHPSPLISLPLCLSNLKKMKKKWLLETFHANSVNKFYISFRERITVIITKVNKCNENHFSYRREGAVFPVRSLGRMAQKKWGDSALLGNWQSFIFRVPVYTHLTKQ